MNIFLLNDVKQLAYSLKPDLDGILEKRKQKQIKKEQNQLKKEKEKKEKINERKNIIKRLLEDNNLPIKYIDNLLCRTYIEGASTTTEYIIKTLSQQHSQYLELKNSFDKYKIQIRNDSKLCNSYISGNNKLSLEEITKIMVETHWLYNYTNYKQLFKEAIDENITDYDETPTQIEKRIRNQVIKQHNGLPNPLPWLT